MANPLNNGTIGGRLAADPKIFTNKDGSRTVLVTVFAENDYPDRQGRYNAEPIPVEAFFSKDTQGEGLFNHLHKGDSVAVAFRLKADNYTDAEGKAHYGLKVRVEGIKPTGSKRPAAAADASGAGEAAQA